MKYRTLKGLQDILPPDINFWHYIEHTAKDKFRRYGFQEIRLPVMESTEVFVRSIGESSDIVEKEMYTFEDKGGRSVTLRPEGTAPFVRAYVENHLHNNPAPQKFYYMGPMFRYERPQAFRYRQFYQIGAEAMGVEEPELDAEIISMLSSILRGIGLEGLNFEITSIGCAECRPGYREVLREFLGSRMGSFCSDCQRRYDINPLRILDCKVPSCIEGRAGAPPVLDYLCPGCEQHFDRLKRALALLHIPHSINPNLVRGLDYYTKTAFEVTSESLGSQKAVAAGGRYDSLVKEFGGPPTPGIGFAMGMERIIPLMKGASVPPAFPDLFFCPLDTSTLDRALLLTEQLRTAGLWVEMNHDSSSLRSQMRKANRVGARHVIVLGPEELSRNEAVIKNMTTKEEHPARLDWESLLRALDRTG